jgi:general transcription factor 3C polypeptide 5 (transcription factor C subunit 1)
MTSTAAPAYKVPPRKVVAVEHPMVIKNLDNGLKTFGTNRPFERVSSFLFDASDKDCISCGSRDESRDTETNLLFSLSAISAVVLFM